MISILHISDSDKHFSSSIDEYLKRLGASAHIDTIKPEKWLPPDTTIIRETAKIKQTLTKKYSDRFHVLLSISWKSIDTAKFVDLVQSSQKTVFIIWWPYGFDEESLWIANKISFGAMTMPHGLAKLVLLEQIYRSECISSGKKYHY